MRDTIPIIEHPIHASPVVEHRRQMFKQVWLPLIASIILFLALVILTIVGAAQGSPQIERWGNLSAVMIILPVLFVGLITLIILGAADYGLSRLLKRIPEWMLKAQLFMIQLALSVRRAADAATKPIFAVNTFSTRASTLWDRIFRRKPAR